MKRSYYHFLHLLDYASQRLLYSEYFGFCTLLPYSGNFCHTPNLTFYLNHGGSLFSFHTLCLGRWGISHQRVLAFFAAIDAVT